MELLHLLLTVFHNTCSTDVVLLWCCSKLKSYWGDVCNYSVLQKHPEASSTVFIMEL